MLHENPLQDSFHFLQRSKIYIPVPNLSVPAILFSVLFKIDLMITF